jgi:hypothetical protein
VYTHTQALQSVKGPGNTFDLSPKWGIALQLGFFYEILIEPPSSFVLKSKLIFDTLL